MRKYTFDLTFVEGQRDAGASWDDIADYYGCARSTLIEWYRKHDGVGPAEEEGAEDERLFNEEQRLVRGIPDLQSVAKLFNAGEDWVPTRVSGSFWEQQSGDGLITLGSLKTAFERNPVAMARVAERILEQAAADMRTHTPAYADFKVEHPTRGVLVHEGPVAFLTSQNDAHVGMYAWSHETGKDDYDLNIAIRDYEAASDKAARIALSYDVEEVIILLGNDFSHIDYIFNKTGGTTKGTPQDYDSRVAKIITAIRRLAVRQIDLGLAYAPKVTVIIVPGNHDRLAMYNLMETLYAWYRNVPEVTLYNAPEEGNYAFPRLRQYYQYGKNGLMFAHGESFKERDATPLELFSTEDPYTWAGTTYREVLAGHTHRTRLDERRGVRIRHLPGLTATDAWHDDNGYLHWRAATNIAYKREGGVAGIHEVEP